MEHRKNKEKEENIEKDGKKGKGQRARVRNSGECFAPIRAQVNRRSVHGVLSRV